MYDDMKYYSTKYNIQAIQPWCLISLYESRLELLKNIFALMNNVDDKSELTVQVEASHWILVSCYF